MQRYTVLQEWTDNVTTGWQLSKLLCPPFGHILIANTNTRNACVEGEGDVAIYSTDQFHEASGGVPRENPEPQGVPVARHRMFIE